MTPLTWQEAMTAACWQGSLAILVAWLVCKSWRTLPPAGRCWLWRIALVKLLAALLWFVPLRLPVLPAPEPPAIFTAQPAPVPSHIPPPVIAKQNAIARHIADPPDPSPRRSINWPTTLLIAWSAGVAIGLVRLTRQWRLASKLRKTGQRIAEDHPLRGAADHLCDRLGIRRPPELRASADVAAPLVVGLMRPVIVLPAEFSTDFPEDVSHVLAHELAHVRRKDLLWNWLDTAAGVLFFFHPLVWLARRESRLAREMACDRLALAVTASPPAEYARTLVDFAQRLSQPGRVPAPALAVCVAESFQSLRRRILAMEHSRLWSRRARAIAAAAAVALALICIPPWRVVAQDDAGANTNTGAADATERKKETQKTTADPARPAAAAERPFRPMFHGALYANTFRLQAASDAVVAEVRVRSGDAVKKGQLLIRFDSRRAEIAVKQAEARYSIARADLKAKEQLLQADPQRQLEFDKTAAAERIAKADLELAIQDLEETQISAPFDGVVQITARPGQRVRAGNDLGELLDRSALHTRFHIPQTMLPQVKTGQPVIVKPDALPGQQFPGRITYIAPVVTSASGTIDVDATLEGPTDALLPGMSVNIDLPSAAPPKDRPR